MSTPTLSRTGTETGYIQMNPGFAGKHVRQVATAAETIRRRKPRVAIPMPELRMSFPQQRHPDLDWADAHASDWVASFGLIPDGRRDDFVLPKIGQLAACGYPTASRAVLALAADWGAWLYAFDDVHVDEGTPDILGVTRQIAAMLAVLDGDRGSTPLALALGDISARFAALSPAHQHTRFTADVKGYLLGVLAECAHRSRGEVPTVADYLPLRLQASACLSCLAIAGLATGEPATGGGDPAGSHAGGIAALTVLGGYVVALANDVYSCLREIDKADVDFVFNLPLVLAYHEDVGLETAIIRSAAIVQDYIDRFTRGYHRLAATLPRPLAGQLDGIAQWTQGTFDWMAACGRYSGYWTPASTTAISTAHLSTVTPAASEKVS